MFTNKIAYFSPKIPLEYIEAWQKEKGNITTDYLNILKDSNKFQRYLFFIDYNDYISTCKPEYNFSMDSYYFPINPEWIFNCLQIKSTISLSEYILPPTSEYIYLDTVTTEDTVPLKQDFLNDEDFNIRLLYENKKSNTIHNQSNRTIPLYITKPQLFSESNSIKRPRKTHIKKQNIQSTSKKSISKPIVSSLLMSVPINEFDKCINMIENTYDSHGNKIHLLEKDNLNKNEIVLCSQNIEDIKKSPLFKLFLDAKKEHNDVGCTLYANLLGYDESFLNTIQ